MSDHGDADGMGRGSGGMDLLVEIEQLRAELENLRKYTLERISELNQRNGDMEQELQQAQAELEEARVIDQVQHAVINDLQQEKDLAVQTNKQLEARVKELENKYRHYHVADHDDPQFRRCKACGAEEIAELFHDTYERLAPKHGYTTREDTRQFDPHSRNGHLMIETCREVVAPLVAAEVERAVKTAPHCNCGKLAVCIGSYEEEANYDYACNDCCGHGNEDGHCVQLEDLPAYLNGISARLEQGGKG